VQTLVKEGKRTTPFPKPKREGNTLISFTLRKARKGFEESWREEDRREASPPRGKRSPSFETKKGKEKASATSMRKRKKEKRGGPSMSLYPSAKGGRREKLMIRFPAAEEDCKEKEEKRGDELYYNSCTLKGIVGCRGRKRKAIFKTPRRGRDVSFLFASS